MNVKFLKQMYPEMNNEFILLKLIYPYKQHSCKCSCYHQNIIYLQETKVSPDIQPISGP